MPYARLLNKSFNFDQENPFTNTAKLDNDLNTYLQEIKDLKTLIETFKPLEYKKYLSRESLNQLAEKKSFLEYLILKPIFDLDLIKNIFPLLKKLEDEEIFFYLLDKLFTDIDNFKAYNNDLQCIWKFLEMSLDDKFKELEKFLNSISDIRIKNLINQEAFIQEYTRLKSLRETVSKGDSAVNKLINLRKQLLTEFEANPPEDMTNDSCPLCGFDWSSESSLTDEFEKINELLESQQSDLAKQLESSEKKLEENYIDPLIQYLEEYTKEKNLIEEKILNILEVGVSRTESVQGNVLNKLDKEILSDFTDLQWDSEKIYKNSYDNLVQDAASFRESLYQIYNYSDEAYKLTQSLQGLSFDSELAKVKTLIGDLYLAESFEKKFQIIQISDLQSNLQIFNQKFESIKSLLEKKSKEIVIENESLSEILINSFDNFFQKNTDEFNAMTLEQILDKENYLRYSASQLKEGIFSKLSERQKKIQLIKNKVDKLRGIYSNQTKEFKASLIKDLKIPFHIFSARILQNYNQGMGIFIFSDQDKIVFSNINKKDHDVTRKLSSGQLAVTSLAFFLTMNKVYRNFNLLNLLAIDDPIQDLDAINIHTFIELLRHEFAGEYQLLIATHDDMNARYMKYKLEKYVKNQEVKQINVQDLFFN